MEIASLVVRCKLFFFSFLGVLLNIIFLYQNFFDLIVRVEAKISTLVSLESVCHTKAMDYKGMVGGQAKVL